MTNPNLPDNDLSPANNQLTGQNGTPVPFPHAGIIDLIRLCNRLDNTSRELWNLTRQMEELIPYAEKKFHVNYQASLESCSAFRVDLEDLIPKLQITAATLLFNTYPLERWKELIKQNFILDVFSAEGLEAISQRIFAANQFIRELIAHVKTDLDERDLIPPENPEE